MNAYDASEQAYKRGYDAGQWELFELITSVYYGKQYYYLDENGLAYSRASHKVMPKEKAIKEFLDEIGW